VDDVHIHCVGIGLNDIPISFQSFHLARLQRGEILLANMNATQLIADGIDLDVLLRLGLHNDRQ
jgi:hypothetical protein